MKGAGRTPLLLRLLGLGLTVQLLVPCTRGAEDQAASTGVLYSPSRCFVVNGLRSPDSLYMARWADEIAEKVESMVGAPVPLSRRSPVRIVGRLDDTLDHARVVKAQGWVDGGLLQRLVIINPSLADQEQILAGLTWLLTNRYLIQRQDPEVRKERPAQAPDWLAHGLAQETYPQLKARNAETIRDAWAEGRRVAFGEVVGWEYLPEGRWLQHAFAGLAVGWLADQAGAGPLFEGLFRQLVREGHVPVEWFSERLGASLPAGGLEAAWQEWVEHQAQRRFAWEHLRTEDLAELGERMQGTMEEALPSARGRPLALGDLLGRSLPPEEVAEAVRSLAALLGKEALGRPEEYQEVLQAFLAFLDEVGKEPDGTARTPEAALQAVRKLEEAQRAMQALARELEARADLMARWEARYLGDGGAVEGMDPASVTRFLDRVESERKP